VLGNKLKKFSCAHSTQSTIVGGGSAHIAGPLWLAAAASVVAGRAPEGLLCLANNQFAI